MRCNRGKRYQGECRDLSVTERIAIKTKGCIAYFRIDFLDSPTRKGWLITADRCRDKGHAQP